MPLSRTNAPKQPAQTSRLTASAIRPCRSATAQGRPVTCENCRDVARCHELSQLSRNSFDGLG